MLVFLFHSDECLDKSKAIVTTRRSKSLVGYIFTDVIRHRMKLRNLGKVSLNLLDDVRRIWI